MTVFALPDEMATLLNLEEITIDGATHRLERVELLAGLPRLRVLRIGYRSTAIAARRGERTMLVCLDDESPG